MADKFSHLRAAGLGLCLLCALYMVYIAASQLAVEKLNASGQKALVIAGVVAVAEGEAVRADGEYTVIQYYYEWDGTDYRNVRPYAVPGCQEGMRMPVVYSIGMGPGTCLTVGIYRKAMLCVGVAGMILFALGTVLKFRKRGYERNGKKKDYSGQLEDEHDSQ